MELNTLKSKLNKAPADIFAITVTYRMDLPFSTKAVKKGLTGKYDIENCYRETIRTGKIKSVYKASGASSGNTLTHQPPKGFTPPTDPDEKGLIYYGSKSNEPYLILQQSDAPTDRTLVDSKYYINGTEVPFADIEEGYNNGIFTKKAIEVPAVRDYSLIPVAKIFAIDIDELETDIEDDDLKALDASDLEDESREYDDDFDADNLL